MSYKTTIPDFGDPYTLESLSLPRPAEGYAIQYLGRDHLLDQNTGRFLAIRNPALKGIYLSFAMAHEAATAWIHKNGGNPGEHPLAIVPVAFDPVSDRHILIYGVLQPELEPVELAACTVQDIKQK